MALQIPKILICYISNFNNTCTVRILCTCMYTDNVLRSSANMTNVNNYVLE